MQTCIETDAHFSKIIAQESVLSHIVNIGIEKKTQGKIFSPHCVCIKQKCMRNPISLQPHQDLTFNTPPHTKLSACMYIYILIYTYIHNIHYVYMYMQSKPFMLPRYIVNFFCCDKVSWPKKFIEKRVYSKLWVPEEESIIAERHVSSHTEQELKINLNWKHKAERENCNRWEVVKGASQHLTMYTLKYGCTTSPISATK